MADQKASSPDFVKKLFQMLGEHEYDHIVRWAPQGDTFLVLDTNEFTKVILPRHFKHSNFASFVRQLNKYDFHKVRQADQALEGNPHGEGTWEFKHPDFNVHNGDSLDSIKRKAPAVKRASKVEAPTVQTQASPKMNGTNFYPSPDVQSLQRQIESMKSMQSGMNNHLQALTRNYQQVISEMLHFQRNMVTQDQVMQNLVTYLMSHANVPANDGSQGIGVDEHAQKLVDEYSEVARQSYEQIEGMTRRASHLGLLPDAGPPSHQSGGYWPQYGSPPPIIPPGQQQQQQLPPPLIPPTSSSFPSFQQSYEPSPSNVPIHHYNPYGQSNQSLAHAAPSPGSYSNSNDSQTPGGNSGYQPSQMFQQQQQRRTEESQRHSQQQQHQLQQQQQQQRLTSNKDERSDLGQPRKEYGDRYQGSMPPSNNSNEFTEQAASMIRAVKSGKKQITPWLVPPKILLVEDDAVCRRLSSKFLSFFGCDIDTAFDGLSAVNKMNEKKYDLVLMDIVMPNLDGVSATSLIRQFDPLTPIISMTSNVESGDVMTYFSHGMNDILPKPFTKDGLLGMLEKHLIHLKTLKQQGQHRPMAGAPDDHVADLAVVSEADYLGMLSGLMGQQIPNASSNAPPKHRRSTEDMSGPDSIHNDMSLQVNTKRAKLEED